jgi:hypothetical protein
MARPNKEGLEYFPLDTRFDEEVLLIDSKFGCSGIGILVKLWQIIYANGYYIKWTERELLLYGGRINADINLVTDIINECLKWGIFNDDLFKKYNILTSRGIQKRFLEATKRRKDASFIFEYSCIDDVKTVNANINLIYVDIKPQNARNKKQIETERETDTETDTETFILFWNEYPNKKAKKEALKAWNKIKNPNVDLILKAIREQKKTKQWLKDNGQFIPLPTTWLNQERWNDEVEKQPPKPEDDPNYKPLPF